MARLKRPYALFFGGVQGTFADRGEAIAEFKHLVDRARETGDKSARGMLDNDNTGERLAIFRGEDYEIEWGEGVDGQK